jgi:hypothetical protein
LLQTLAFPAHRPRDAPPWVGAGRVDLVDGRPVDARSGAAWPRRPATGSSGGPMAPSPSSRGRPRPSRASIADRTSCCSRARGRSTSAGVCSMACRRPARAGCSPPAPRCGRCLRSPARCWPGWTHPGACRSCWTRWRGLDLAFQSLAMLHGEGLVEPVDIDAPPAPEPLLSAAEVHTQSAPGASAGVPPPGARW